MLTAGGPPPAANPPGASFPHNPLQYNIIYVQRGVNPAAAEIEAVLSFRVDNNEHCRVRAAAATDCEIQKKRSAVLSFLDRTDRVLFALSAQVAVRGRVRRVSAASERWAAEYTIP